jgi:hypothetical protein
MPYGGGGRRELPGEVAYQCSSFGSGRSIYTTATWHDLVATTIGIEMGLCAAENDGVVTNLVLH